jgi:anti-anti-sigma regulatory factor
VTQKFCADNRFVFSIIAPRFLRCFLELARNRACVLHTLARHGLGAIFSQVFPRYSHPHPSLPLVVSCKYDLRADGMRRAHNANEQEGNTTMLNVHVEKLGEMAVVQCEGRIVRSEAAFKLREAVTSQADARIIVVELSEVGALEGGGLSMLVFLQRWAQDHDIRLKLFNPRGPVRSRLQHVSSMREFDIASLDEMMALMARAELPYAHAS